MDEIRPGDLSLILVFGMAGMFVLATSIILFVLVYKRKIIEGQLLHQQELIQTAVEIQEEERKRFAADLHDEIGGGISTILLSISGLETYFKDTVEVHGKISNIRNQLNDVLDGVRTISHNITPSSLEVYGLMAALSDLCYQIQETGVIDVDLECEEINPRLSMSKELAIYRICKELFSNTIKHAEASRIIINVTHTEEFLNLKYTDNGRGYIDSKHYKGNGIKNMVNRAKILGAQLTIESKLGKETTANLLLKL